jgi:hypothetical protein
MRQRRQCMDAWWKIYKHIMFILCTIGNISLENHTLSTNCWQVSKTRSSLIDHQINILATPSLLMRTYYSPLLSAFTAAQGLVQHILVWYKARQAIWVVVQIYGGQISIQTIVQLHRNTLTENYLTFFGPKHLSKHLAKYFRYFARCLSSNYLR